MGRFEVAGHCAASYFQNKKIAIGEGWKMRLKGHGTTPRRLAARVAQALSHERADVVIKGGEILDVFGGGFWKGDVAVCGETIVGTHDAYDGAEEFDARGCYVVPGFVDAHVHIESSMVTPARFQEGVLPLGTTTALWDPHEIANVHGREAIAWALDAVEPLLMDIFVLLPSCVPATHLETSGARLDAADLLPFRDHPSVLGLAEFMNVPGLLGGDPQCVDKVTAFSNQVRDGHAPELRGKALNAYLSAGIHGCHECTTRAEAREKLRKGMHVLVREGSCAKDARELLPLVDARTSAVIGLCSDDRNPADIAHEGHINYIVNMALALGREPEDVFRAASFGAAHSYGLKDRGVLAPGYLADVCVVRQAKPGDWSGGVEIVAVFKSGVKVDTRALRATADAASAVGVTFSRMRNVVMPAPRPEKFQVKARHGERRARVKVIGVRDGQILTDQSALELDVDPQGNVRADVHRDVLKIAVCERHWDTGNVGVGFVRGFGIKGGALAASIGHDAHNVTVVGSGDKAIVAAVDALRDMDGGIVVVDADGGVLASLKLEIAGLMTGVALSEVTDRLVALKEAARAIGCGLQEPFLQMSFLALPVIPSLKITDRGLVDVGAFALVDVVEHDD